MSKQTRRSISVRGATYDALRKHCDKVGRSMSDIVEELLAKVLEAAPPPTSTISRPAPRPVMANKVVKKPASAAPLAVGRPAPTPAQEVVPQRVKAPKGDYRNIRF